MIDGCLSAVLAQEVDLEFDVVVAAGPSRDDTAARIDAWATRDPRVRRVDNSSGTTPAALNRAIAESTGDLVVRVDAQAVVPEGYLQRLLDSAGRTGAGNVGGSNARSGRAVGRRRLRPPCGHRSASVRPSSAAEAMRGRPTPSISGRSVGLRSKEVRRLRRDPHSQSGLRTQLAASSGRFVIWLDPALVVEYTPRSFAPGPLEPVLPVRPMEASGRVPQSTLARSSPACGTGARDRPCGLASAVDRRVVARSRAPGRLRLSGDRRCGQ